MTRMYITSAPTPQVKSPRAGSRLHAYVYMHAYRILFISCYLIFWGPTVVVHTFDPTGFYYKGSIRH